ncbi:MAG: aromatic ring hydroxylase [Lentimonas sp.]|jgi:aromatic ring hydroxylase
MFVIVRKTYVTAEKMFATAEKIVAMLNMMEVSGIAGKMSEIAAKT